MIDIHSHILPRVDDGADSMEVSIKMARMYIEGGFKTVIATPHYIEGAVATSIDNNKIMLDSLRVELIKEQLDLEVLLGNEAYISMELVKDIEGGKVATLNGTRYVLVEFPMLDIPIYAENMIYELLLKGYIPIIAHPERNAKIMEDPNILYNYIQKGALSQLNLPSLEGRYGRRAKEVAKILLKHDMIHFVSTDAHTNRGRSPRVKDALVKLSEIVSRDDFERLINKNAEILLKNQIIKIKSPTKYKEKKHIFRFFTNTNKTSRVRSL